MMKYEEFVRMLYHVSKWDIILYVSGFILNPSIDTYLLKWGKYFLHIDQHFVQKETTINNNRRNERDWLVFVWSYTSFPLIFTCSFEIFIHTHKHILYIVSFLIILQQTIHISSFIQNLSIQHNTKHRQNVKQESCQYYNSYPQPYGNTYLAKEQIHSNDPSTTLTNIWYSITIQLHPRSYHHIK